MSGILMGVDPLVDAALNLTDVGREPHYQHMESWIRLSRQKGVPERWPKLIAEMATLIEANWTPQRSRGQQNWRHTKQLKIADRNPSPEKCLEKGIARFLDSSWSNQVPICSGLGDAHDGKRCVDLAHLSGDNLELIELKVDSNNPLFAAVEVLIYGLVYRLSRKHRETLGYQPSRNPLVFTPHSIALKVLAPADYYGSTETALKGMEDGICAGLAALPREDYRMAFLFESFRSPPITKDAITASLCEEIIQRRAPVVAR